MNIKKTILKILGYIWVFVADITILLAVFSMISQFMIAAGFIELFALIFSTVITFAAYAHLKFRHRIRGEKAKRTANLQLKIIGYEESRPLVPIRDVETGQFIGGEDQHYFFQLEAPDGEAFLAEVDGNVYDKVLKTDALVID